MGCPQGGGEGHTATPEVWVKEKQVRVCPRWLLGMFTLVGTLVEGSEDDGHWTWAASEERRGLTPAGGRGLRQGRSLRV